jgi:hypothetical protein
MFSLFGKLRWRGEPLRSADVRPRTHTGACHARPDLPRLGLRDIHRIRPVRPRAQEDLTVIISLLYGAAAIIIAGYMVAALLRPDKF